MKEKACEVGAGDLLEASGWLWVEISLTANVTKARGAALGKGTRGASLNTSGSKRPEAR